MILSSCALAEANGRGQAEQSGSWFIYVDLEVRVAEDHPLRAVRGVVKKGLSALSGDFSVPHSRSGRPSIPPEEFSGGDTVAGVLFDPVGAAVGRLQKPRQVEFVLIL